MENLDQNSDLLRCVRGPSRYLGTEKNAVHKDFEKAKTRLCLAFPDLYEVGVSHFGMQILYHLVNERPEALAERVFCPDHDLESLLLSTGRPLFSLESGRPVKDFDILGVSLLYELNYSNLVTVLKTAGIPILAAERGPGDPVVIGGGPSTVNPEPVAAFFDALVVGEGEEVLTRLLDAFEKWKTDGGGARETLLETWSGITGVYVPSFYEEREGRLVPRKGAPATVIRALVEDLDKAFFPAKPVVPYSNPVHDRLRLEVARGCANGCRFCQAGMIYRPLRERGVNTIVTQAEEGLAATGYEDLSLLSLSTGDYSDIETLMTRILRRCAPGRVAVSLPSLRAGTLTRELVRAVKTVRKTGFTIAPEAGTQRLRDVINKNLTEEEILSAVTEAFNAGWRNVKLYFMIGLPTETREDVQGIVDLAKRLKDAAGKRRDITVSVGTFVPKPHTPFQWAAQLTREEALERLSMIRRSLKGPGIKVKWQNPELSVLEGVMARGGRELAPVILTAHEMGARMDGWTESFDFDLWVRALADHGLSPDRYLRTRDVDEPLPWDAIDVRVSRDYLLREWKRAKEEKTTPACTRACSDCGVCREGGPDVIRSGRTDPPPPAQAPPPAEALFTCRIAYAKTGPARYLGHLEFMNAVTRALKRAGMPLAYSQGFHPLPKVSFGRALPVLVESEEEEIRVGLTRPVRGEKIAKDLEGECPAGIQVLEVTPVLAGKKTVPEEASAGYRVTLEDWAADPEKIRAFLERDSYVVEKPGKRGRVRKVDLKESVIRLHQEGPATISLELSQEPGKSMKPMEILKYIFSLERPETAVLRMVKTPVSAAQRTATP